MGGGRDTGGRGGGAREGKGGGQRGQPQFTARSPSSLIHLHRPSILMSGSLEWMWPQTAEAHLKRSKMVRYV